MNRLSRPARDSSFLVMISLLFAGTIAVLAQRFLPSNERGATLDISEERLCFGNAWEQPAFVWNLPIRNRSSNRVEVTQLRPSCGCASITPTTFTIPPHGQIDVEVRLDLRTRRNRRTTIEPYRPFDLRIAGVLAAQPEDSNEWTLNGTVWRCPLEVVPQEVLFGESLVAGCLFPAVHVAVTPTTGCGVVRAHCDRSIVVVTVESHPDNRDEYQLTIRPAPDLSVGVHECYVYLTCDLPSEGSLPDDMDAPQFALPVKMKVIPSWYIAPESVVLGVEMLGETLEYRVVAGVLDGAPFNVSCQLDSSSTAEVRREYSDQESPDPKPFRITQRVDQLGKVVTRIQFIFDIRGKPRKVVNVPVSYFGVDRSS